MHAVHTAIRFPLICRFAYAGTEECRMLKAGATIEASDNERSSLPGNPLRIECNYDLLDY